MASSGKQALSETSAGVTAACCGVQAARDTAPGVMASSGGEGAASGVMATSGGERAARETTPTGVMAIFCGERAARAVATPGVTAASSGERDVARHLDSSCLRLFRRRRLLAFLRREKLLTTFDALKTETRAFFDVRFLRRLVVAGRWREAAAYIKRFLPSSPLDGEQNQRVAGVEALTVLKFISHLNLLDDLAHGNPEAARTVAYLDRRIDADPSIMEADPHYREVIRTIFYVHSHPGYRESLDWHLVRRTAAKKVSFYIKRARELRHFMRLPRCPIDPYRTVPFGSGFGRLQRHHGKKCRASASLLARRFLPKDERRSTFSARDSVAGLSYSLLEAMIDDSLLAGEPKVQSQSPDYSCDEDESLLAVEQKVEEQSLDYACNEVVASAG